MKIQENVPLAPLCSLRVGGHAEKLITITSSSELKTAVKEGLQGQSLQKNGKPLWVLGFGTNVLISDKGLPGTTLLIRTTDIELKNDELIADAGVWWDDAVKLAIDNNLWGIELMSGIPGSIGAAVVGNVAAYGQSTDQTLKWIETLNWKSGQIKRLPASELDLQYRSSAFYSQGFKNQIIIRAGFKLSRQPLQKLEYQSALNIAQQYNLSPDNLCQCREIIMKSRDKSGSLYTPEDKSSHCSAGSFFRNPLVSQEQADYIISFEENSVSSGQIKAQNKLHGGSQTRVSAAHVLLAAGFKRGQTWGNVRLHPEHVLKIENTGGATAQEIYDVSQQIIQTVKDKLGIDLQPEPRFLGDFNNK